MPSPNFGLLGYNFNYCPYDGGGFGESRREYCTDTLHDRMNAGNAYVANGTSQRLGDNTFIELTACGGAIVDSISFADDFSEFTFLDLPRFPDTIAAGKSLILHYQIIPSILGKHKRPLVFHLHGGGTIVWSFEYEVVPPLDVAESGRSSELLLSSYPNPLESSTTLHYSLPSPSPITLTLFDALGREVARPVGNEMQNAGEHEVTLDARNLPAGIYECRLIAGGDVRVSKLVVTR
jgi:hypothetical protein